MDVEHADVGPSGGEELERVRASAGGRPDPDPHAVVEVCLGADSGVDAGVRRVGGEVEPHRELRRGAGAVVVTAAAGDRRPRPVRGIAASAPNRNRQAAWLHCRAPTTQQEDLSGCNAQCPSPPIAEPPRTSPSSSARPRSSSSSRWRCRSTSSRRRRGLPQPFIDWSVIGLVHVFVLFMLIQTLALVSGAHFNPAVTAALTVIRQIKPIDAAIYIVVQLAGATLGALMTKGFLVGRGQRGELRRGGALDRDSTARSSGPASDSRRSARSSSSGRSSASR